MNTVIASLKMQTPVAVQHQIAHPLDRDQRQLSLAAQGQSRFELKLGRRESGRRAFRTKPKGKCNGGAEEPTPHPQIQAQCGEPRRKSGPNGNDPLLDGRMKSHGGGSHSANEGENSDADFTFNVDQLSRPNQAVPHSEGHRLRDAHLKRKNHPRRQ